MKRANLKRAIVIFLLVLLCAQLLPASAFAAEPGMSAFAPKPGWNGDAIYTDLDSTASYYPAAHYVLSTGVFINYGKTFRPNDPLTGGVCLTAAVKIYEAYHGIVPTDTGSAGDEWYDPYIRRARSYGILTESSINCKAVITQDYANALICRSLPSAELPMMLNFQYIPGMAASDAYYAQNMTLYRAGVLTSAVPVQPKSTMKRSDFCRILAKLLLPSWRRTGANSAFYDCFPVDLSNVSCSFVDVSKSAWYYQSVASQQMLGIFNGTDSTHFMPNEAATIAQVITTAVRIYERCHNTTIPAASGPRWYDIYVNKAIACGIIKAGRYAKYNASATRLDTVDILYRAIPAEHYTPIVPVATQTYNGVSSLMPDFNSDNAGYARVSAWYQAGILTGSDRYGSFNANQPVKRSELATIVFRMVVPSQREINRFDAAYKLTIGKSYQGRTINAYQIGNGKNVMLLNFAIHGWEDNFARDGQVLANTAIQLRNMLLDNYDSLINSGDWTVYIIPIANPDGLYAGWTNNGPGRCTLHGKGYDLNRCFPTSRFTAYWGSRNYNGGSALIPVESKVLYNFTKSVYGTGKNVLFDVHGWYDQIIPAAYQGKLHTTMRKYFPSASYASLSGAAGYYSCWAKEYGYDACLFEFPTVWSAAQFRSKGYGTAFCNAISSLLKTY